MDWTNWTPVEVATLCFIHKGGQVLLIRKKSGLGAGKINAPGGRLEAGETPLEAAIRETQEEVGLTPCNLEKHGELHFQFIDGYSLFCTVFIASHCHGTMCETDEADPFWVSADSVPYDGMWADDIHWLPLILGGRRFRGYFEFDGETMLWHRVEVVEDFDRSARPIG